jgi:hypothetical protein
MRYLERRPVRTKLQRKTVTAANIKPETITADEVNFGTAIITTETDTNNVAVDNPKDGLLIVSSTNGSSSVYSGSDDAFISITDIAAQDAADAALEEAAAAADAALAAEAAAQAAEDEALASSTAAFDASEAAAAAEAAAQISSDGAAAAADAALASADGAGDALAQALASAEAAQAAADQATASAEAAAAADDAAVLAAEEAAAADAAAGIAAEEAAAADAAAALAAEQAGYAALQAEDAADSAGLAVDEAAAAAASALAATESANKKNSVFRAPASAYAPATAPTANTIGDIWFDTTPLTNDNGAGGAKPKRWNGTIWEPFGLSYAAITSIDADTITTGTLTGRTIKTSASGNRVELSNSDVISFYNNDGVTVGTIQPGFSNEGLILTAGSGGSSLRMTGDDWAADSSIFLETNNNGGSIIMFDDTYDGEAGGGIFITASNLYMQGNGGWQISDLGSGSVIYGFNGDLSLGGGLITLSGDVYVSGDLTLSPGTYQQGTGQPTGTPSEGTIVFRYV